MSVWDAYKNRIDISGRDRRTAALRREQRFLATKLPENLSYQTAIIDDIEQNVAIINSDNLNEKSIYSMPGGDIPHGGIVVWQDNHWLVTERDPANEVYTKAKMLQCNYLLKWIDRNGLIHEQWCIIEDGTKLRRIHMRYSLAYRKRCVKRTPLIAGNP